MWKTVVIVLLAAFVAAVTLLLAAIVFPAAMNAVYDKNMIFPLGGCLWAFGILALSAIDGGHEKSR